MRPTGTSGPVKLAKKEAKPVTAAATKKSEPKAEKKVTEKKTAEKKTTEKKAPATKKATATVSVSLP
jgi:histone H1/5